MLKLVVQTVSLRHKGTNDIQGGTSAEERTFLRLKPNY